MRSCDIYLDDPATDPNRELRFVERTLMRDHTIIALDLSTTCTGVAIGKPSGARPSAVYSVKRQHKDQLHNLVALTNEIRTLVQSVAGPRILAIEDLHSTRNANTTKLLASLRGAVVYACAPLCEYKVVFVHQAQAKKHLRLPGNADKAVVFDMIKTMGIPVANEDESDACAVWYAAPHLYHDTQGQ
jgi:Holliday junction resolvasome RuvABC endonuclease subunit